MAIVRSLSRIAASTAGRRSIIEKRGTAGLIAGALLFGSCALSSLTEGEDLSLSQIIENRQANFHDLGAAFKNIRDLLDSSNPSRIELRGYVQSLDDIAHYQASQDWFPPGSGPEAGIKTKAKSEIWVNSEEFQKWRKALPVETDKLQTLITGNAPIAAIKAQHHLLGETCAGCHKVFREKEV